MDVIIISLSQESVVVLVMILNYNLFFPRIFNQVHITRGPESPLVPYDIEIDGAIFKLQDYKRILPQSPLLLEWYDRIVLGE